MNTDSARKTQKLDIVVFQIYLAAGAAKCVTWLVRKI